jgi:hypothetical protein
MAILHYRVSRCDHSWVVSCEDVPIQDFAGQDDAVGAATKLVAKARQRGDHVFLRVDSPSMPARSRQPKTGTAGRPQDQPRH